MSRRYSYTPRRSGNPPGGGITSLPLWIPLVVIAFVVFLAWFVTRGGGDGCEGEGCPQVLALGETPAAVADEPSPVPDGDERTASPTPARPRRTPGRSISAQAAPQTTALAAALVEAPCGVVLHELNAGTPLPPASLTKIMTALVAVDHGDPAAVIDITIDGGELSLATDATVMGVKPGQRLSLRDLLYGLLLRSGNDAALTIAEHVAGDEASFVDLMNEKAAALGLTDTNFANPHGLDAPGHYTSAHDMALLGAALLADPLLAEIVRTQTYQPAWDGGELENLNLLINGYPGALGIKTGYTDQAGATIVGAAERDGRMLVVSALHTNDLYVDAAELLEWGFESTEPACDPGQALSAAP